MVAGVNGSTAIAPLKMVVTARHYADLAGAAPARVGAPKPARGKLFAYMVLAMLATLAWLRFVDAYGPQDDGAAINLLTITVLSSCFGVLLMLAGIAVWNKNQLRGFAERALREDGVVIGPRTLSLSDEGITIEGANVHFLTRWPAFQEISEIGETVLIWTDPAAAILVPKSAFHSDDARQDFMAEISRRIVQGAPA